MPSALGLLEFKSVAAGIQATDAMLKTAQVELLFSSAVCPGKYVTIIAGEVSAVRSSLEAGRSVGEPFVVGEFVLASVHPSVLPAITATTGIEAVDAVGVVETFSVATAILAGDAAAKAAEIELIEIRIARGLGGKAFAIFTGNVAAVEAAMAVAIEPAKSQGLLTHYTVLPAPHPDLVRSLL